MTPRKTLVNRTPAEQRGLEESWARHSSRTESDVTPVTSARRLTSEELADCCGGCRTNSAIETWMQRAIAKFCEVNGIALTDGVGACVHGEFSKPLYDECRPSGRCLDKPAAGVTPTGENQ